MKKHLFGWLSTIIISVLIINAINLKPVQAEAGDVWWDDAWPYRVAVEVTGSGEVGVNLDFSSLFSNLGLVGAILDLQSIRVVPYSSGVPHQTIPFQETYSTPLMDGDELNLDPSEPEPYWVNSDQSQLSLDNEKFSQGSSSIKAEITIKINLSPQPDFTYNFNGYGKNDWSQYESLLYHVWPEVNESAIDQTPNLFQLELLGLGGCYPRRINGPAMSMDQWNPVSLTLNPFNFCTSPDYSDLTGLRFFVRVDQFGVDPGNYEPGDQVSLWLDDFRLVDQDGPGEIQWVAEPGIDRYYIYFDTLNHTGHPNPDLTTLSDVQSGLTVSGEAESGGYFHQISGVNSTSLSIWHAPIEEKILRSQTAPITQKPLIVTAARGETEPFQLIIRSEMDTNLNISVSDLIKGSHTIPAGQIDIFRVDYIELTQLSDSFGRLTDWPDPLIPIVSGTGVSLTAGKDQPIWFRIKVPPSMPSGDYSGLITIGSAAVPFTLKVWDIYLPSTAKLPMQIGFDWETVLEAYGGTENGVPQPCYDVLTNAIASTLAEYHLSPLPEGSDKPDGLVYSITNYEVEEAHLAQIQSGVEVWWSFDSNDDPPLPNPSIIDRTGLEARILPWMAWLDRVDGLFYKQVMDWDPDPWVNPYSNDLSNGDGFLFYPPKDDSLGYDPCNPASNRLIPSIRLELLREGLEDYAYLKLVNGRDAAIGQENDSDLWAGTLIGSRTAFLHPPTDLADLRANLADLLQTKDNDIYLPLLFH